MINCLQRLREAKTTSKAITKTVLLSISKTRKNVNKTKCQANEILYRYELYTPPPAKAKDIITRVHKKSFKFLTSNIIHGLNTKHL